MDEVIEINLYKKTFPSKQLQIWFLFWGILAIYFLLVVPTLKYKGFSWDEEIDLRIARAYLTPSGFFLGLPLDFSQTRLPMFLPALLFRLVGVDNLLIGRWASVVAGALTLLAVYVYGKVRFGNRVGLLAAGILAISPFFLSFAREAFTGSDIYLACTLSWLLVTLSRLLDKPTVGRAAIGGLFFGLSLSSKATSLVILPAIWIVLCFSHITASKEIANKYDRPNHSVPALVVLFWAGWAIIVLLIGVYSRVRLNLHTYSLTIQVIHYVLVCLGGVMLWIWVFRHRNHVAGYIPLFFLVTGAGLLTFVIFPPDHLTDTNILRSLFLRAENEMSFSVSFMGELAALHLLAITFKSTLLLGLSLLLGVALSIFQWRRIGLLPLLVLLSYFAGLLILPLGQTFYVIPLLPILSLLAAYQFERLWYQRRKIAYILSFLVIGWWGMEMVQIYPDYHLDGYQWLGTRVIFGRSSIGSRSIVFTPSDGVQQAIEWLNSNAGPDQIAQLYVGPWHIVRYFAPNPHYHLTNGHEESLLSKPDYVVVHINELIDDGFGRDMPVGEVILYPFDQEMLRQEYEKVYSVQRAFGIEMVSIWQRK